MNKPANDVKFDIYNIIATSIPNGVKRSDVLRGTVLFLAEVIDQYSNDETVIKATESLLRLEINNFKEGNYTHGNN